MATDQLCHTTPHPVYSHYWVKHSLLTQTTNSGEWSCAHCHCPHIEMPDGEGAHYLVAFRSVECPNSFVEPCPDCGQVYACIPGCEYIGPLEKMIDNIMLVENGD